MKRRMTVLYVVLLIAGVALLAVGLYALNGYFREKKLNEGFGTLSLSESDSSGLVEEMFGKFGDVIETANDKADDIEAAEDGLANLRTEVKMVIQAYLDLEVKTPEDTKNLLSSINAYVKGVQNVLKLQGDYTIALELEFTTLSTNGSMGPEQSSLIGTMKNSQADVSRIITGIISEINTIASSLAAEGTVAYQDQIDQIISLQGRLVEIENVNVSD